MSGLPSHRTAKPAASNLNHLLNFSLPPRQSRPLSSLPRRARKTGNSHGIWNKERFVNAQYRFVMNPNGDYTAHFADPDMHVSHTTFFQWQDILQVIIPRSPVLTFASPSFPQDDNQTACPICLSPPTAPRMTKCGHIFCFSCILHYLSTSDNKWVRCPICFDSVTERQLKSVKWFDGLVHDTDNAMDSPPVPSSSSSVIDNTFESMPALGSSLSMRLIQRPQITTLALPRSHTWPSDLLPPHQAPFHFLPDVYSFAKFMLATPAHLISDFTGDLDQLASERRTLASFGDDLGTCFIDAAETRVRLQIAAAAALDTPALKAKIEKAIRDKTDLEERTAFHQSRRKNEQLARKVPQEEVPVDFLAIKSPSTHSSAPSTPAELETDTPREVSARLQPRNHPKQRRNVNPPPPNTQTYYYYQAASGLPIYLHPLDIRILLSHFGSYPAFPGTIAVKVEGYSESTIDDNLRKRCKYLAHLPEGADVVFVEADLEDVVGADSLKNFESLLKSRILRRKEKGKKDDKAKARAEEREREREKHWASSLVYSSSRSEAIAIQEIVDHSSSSTSELENSSSLPRQNSGAWGTKSFASALHSPSTPVNDNRGQDKPREKIDDEWDMDAAWHELQQQRSGGGKKKNTKLVILGGGGGRRR
ncbi:hypothetical protein AGABI1DRAFT_67079 [Agaricus bisporus var. burnettii JB137-S8]|uniref:RING-type domain-containing protein n=1 Tax=Agaricus bisporus var. burnettii (strain JB137-S8 / ATCC MYA-4627 / FGSC 10392) TaxID=597362 RepID=K5XKP6_AGABU|nr:uncharacterized protein AGABI1DRAFT_67079 [Agaricus bisporus var. burnettii JB137-S8]EKM83967.1 hypothetical protein AGABI1DRAFT_67079 [Agaricus bisporus var. burnettii JB137-S8]